MIRKIRAQDRDEYLDMARAFYASDAVLAPVDDQHLTATFDELMRSDAYAECYLLEREGAVAGYALLAKSFSQEAGGRVCWIDELFIRPEWRGKGLGTEFFTYLRKNVRPRVKRLRLEVEKSNVRAVKLYARQGFTELPYMQMIADTREETWN